jgi:RNA polymerase sigma factor (sigma-70 family)
MDDKRARFEAQVLPHLDAAYRFARWLAARSSVEVDDLVQEAFLRAFRGFDGLRGGDVRAWVLAIVRNCHATAIRRERRRAIVPLPDEDSEPIASGAVAAVPGPETASLATDERRTLEELIAALPPEQREVLALREIEGLSYREIGVVTGVPIGTVMSRLARARAALRTRYLENNPGEPRAVR